MTRFLLLPALALAFTACEPAADAPEASGDDVVTDAPDSGAEMGAIDIISVSLWRATAEILPVAAVIERADDLDGETVVVEGTISKICQQKGCWMTLENEAGETFRVAVPKDEAGDYVFTFPMDATGATARLAGTFTLEEESVETLRHLAEDEGQSPEAIDAITAPQRTYVLTASGARLTRA